MEIKIHKNFCGINGLKKQAYSSVYEISQLFLFSEIMIPITQKEKRKVLIKIN